MCFFLINVNNLNSLLISFRISLNSAVIAVVVVFVGVGFASPSKECATLCAHGAFASDHTWTVANCVFVSDSTRTCETNTLASSIHTPGGDVVVVCHRQSIADGQWLSTMSSRLSDLKTKRLWAHSPRSFAI